jgi:hypothetical protein
MGLYGISILLNQLQDTVTCFSRVCNSAYRSAPFELELETSTACDTTARLSSVKIWPAA